MSGGAGFIGHHLVRHLVDEGWSVSVVDDLSSGSPAHLASDIELVRVDIADASAVARIEALRPQLIVHTAAQVSVIRSQADPERDREVNLDGTRHVLEGARVAGCRRIVFLSSGGAVYGEADGARETDVPSPRSYYGIHKLAAEGYVANSGMSFANLRLSNVYGPGQRADLEGGVAAIFADALRTGRPVTIYGDGHQTRDLTFVEDVARAVVAAARVETSGTWNVATGRASSVIELLAELERQLRPAVAVKREPERPGEVRTSSLSPALAMADLGWQATFDVAAGLARTVAAQ